MKVEIYSVPMTREEKDKWDMIRKNKCPVCGKSMRQGKLKLTAQGYIHKRCGRAK